MIRLFLASLTSALALGLAGCSAVTPPQAASSLSDGGVPTFGSEAAVEEFADDANARLQRDYDSVEYALSDVVVTGAKLEEAPSITNNQEAGVDEGGLVKATKDFLIVLRRGRIFTIRHGGNALAPIDAIDVFAPGDDNPDDAWYDELLVSGNMVVVIGYSYGDGGTEISRFELGSDGSLTYRDTHYLTSADYYSSSNYASRLIDGELVLYAPIPINWSNWRGALPAVRQRMPDGSASAPRALVPASNVHIPAHLREDTQRSLDILHSVTRCDVTAEDFDCESAAVVGSWSRNFYITGEAVYIWTQGAGHSIEGHSLEGDDNQYGDLLYRIGLELDEVTAIGVNGAPIDQFSFRDDEDTDSLFVFARDFGFGDAMWGAEVSGGETALVRIPQDSFGDGSQSLSRAHYRPLASPEGWRVQNRFVGRHLLYSGNDYRSEGAVKSVFVTPLDAPWVQKLRLPHGVTRLDMIGEDAIAIGPKGARGDSDDAQELGFSAIALGDEDEGWAASLVSTATMPAAREGEARSHGFFFKPDASSEVDGDGVMALPVQLELDDDRYEFLGSASALSFVARRSGELSAIGMINAAYDEARPDGCQASCVDWYGNARPIFLGDRMIALMGYEMIEGQIADGAVKELRRIDFTPSQ